MSGSEHEASPSVSGEDDSEHDKSHDDDEEEDEGTEHGEEEEEEEEEEEKEEQNEDEEEEESADTGDDAESGADQEEEQGTETKGPADEEHASHTDDKSDEAEEEEDSTTGGEEEEEEEEDSETELLRKDQPNNDLGLDVQEEDEEEDAWSELGKKEGQKKDTHEHTQSMAWWWTASFLSLFVASAVLATWGFVNTIKLQDHGVHLPSDQPTVDGVYLLKYVNGTLTWNLHNANEFVGDSGATGPTGIQGETGPQGPDGTNGSWDITQPISLSLTELEGDYVYLQHANGSYKFRIGVQSSQQSFYLMTKSNHILRLGTNNAENLRIYTNGHVSIGSTSHLARLSVTHSAVSHKSAAFGDAANNGQFFVTSSDTNRRVALGYDPVNEVGVIQAIKVGDQVKPIMLNPAGGEVCVGAQDPSGSKALYVQGDTQTTGNLRSASATVTGATQTDTFECTSTSQLTGNVGVGQAPATEKLNVAGTVRINAGGSLYVGNGFWNTTTGNDVYINAASDVIYVRPVAGSANYQVTVDATNGLRIHDSSGGVIVYIKPDGQVIVGDDTLGTASLTLKRAAETSYSTPNSHVRIGGSASVNQWYFVSFGYDSNYDSYSPGYIGFQVTNAADHTMGEFVIATRAVTTDTAPTERLRVKSDGTVDVAGNAQVLGKLGVGGAVGSEALEVTGSAHVTTTAQIDGNTGMGGAPGSEKLLVTGSARVTTTTQLDGNVGMGAASGSEKLLVTGSARVTTTTQLDGNVGMGAASGSEQLLVTGSTHVTTTTQLDGNVGIGAASDGANRLYVTGGTIKLMGRVGILNDPPDPGGGAVLMAGDLSVLGSVYVYDAQLSVSSSGQLTNLRGIKLFASNNDYRIGFDATGAGGKGYIRVNVDISSANHGIVFSSGSTSTPAYTDFVTFLSGGATTFLYPVYVGSGPNIYLDAWDPANPFVEVKSTTVGTTGFRLKDNEGKIWAVEMSGADEILHIRYYDLSVWTDHVLLTTTGTVQISKSLGIGVSPVTYSANVLTVKATSTAHNTLIRLVELFPTASDNTIGLRVDPIHPTAPTFAYGINVYPTIAASATVPSYAGILVDAGTCSGCTVDNAYGAILYEPSFGTTKWAAWISGKTQITTELGIGASVAAYVTDVLTVGATTAAHTTLLHLAGLFPTASDNTVGLLIDAVHPTAPTFAYDIHIWPTIATDAVIPTYAGIVVNPGSCSGCTVTTAYGIYAAPPAFGTSKWAGHFADRVHIGNSPPGAGTSAVLNLYQQAPTNGMIHAHGVASGTHGTLYGVRYFLQITGGTSGGTISTSHSFSRETYMDGVLADKVTNHYDLYFPAVATPAGITNKYGAYIAYPVTIGDGLAVPVSILHVYESTESTGTTAGLTIQQASTGDSVLQFVRSTQRIYVGVDGTDDKFKVSTGAALGSTDAIIVDDSGHVYAEQKFHITNGNAPADATTACTAGQIAWGSGFIYVCVATNSWQRAALAAW
jgi:hypothetical protein